MRLLFRLPPVKPDAFQAPQICPYPGWRRWRSSGWGLWWWPRPASGSGWDKREGFGGGGEAAAPKPPVRPNG